jgi:hypothetical protein
MFGLSYLFYPWGFILQGVAIVHFVRRRPENYWFYISTVRENCGRFRLTH